MRKKFDVEDKFKGRETECFDVGHEERMLRIRECKNEVQEEEEKEGD